MNLCFVLVKYLLGEWYLNFGAGWVARNLTDFGFSFQNEGGGGGLFHKPRSLLRNSGSNILSFGSEGDERKLRIEERMRIKGGTRGMMKWMGKECGE